jgi:hypothetical protein
MRPGLPLAGGLAAFALVLGGAFVASKMIRPSSAVAGPPLTWEIAPDARPRVVHASAPRRSLRPLAPRAHDKECPPPRLPAATRAVTAANAFRVRLEPSPQTPRGYAYADALRAALARRGAVAARPAGRVIWAVDRQFVARLDDGAHVAVVGGYGVTELSFRQLTPDTCRLLFATAQGARASVAYPGGRIEPEGPLALCARLGPAFEAWRGAAPAAPLDLADLDRRNVSISRPGGGPAPARRSQSY